jgi:hypothetical protein
MKQLTFDFGGHKTPTFREWYSENSHEKSKYGEKPYTESEAQKVYSDLIANGFFKRGGYNAKAS